MIRDDEGLGAATWLTMFSAATLILILIWLLASLLHPSVWRWLLNTPPELWLALFMLGVISVWWPR